MMMVKLYIYTVFPGYIVIGSDVTHALMCSHICVCMCVCVCRCVCVRSHVCVCVCVCEVDAVYYTSQCAYVCTYALTYQQCSPIGNY